MARHSDISWAPATWNGWIGCEKLSPACDHCYAEALARRYGWAKWGKDEPRRRTSEEYWKQPLRWQVEASRTGQRLRVFAFSLADWAEDRRDLDPWRTDFFDLIEATPDLDWMLLTKRANCLTRLLPSKWLETPRSNVWLGVTAENQRRADERIPELLRVPAVVHWVSAEPLLEAINFRPWLREACDCFVPALDGAGQHSPACAVFNVGLDWVVVGGESGAGARRMELSWARDILEQCRAREVAYHFKQKGGVLAAELHCKNRDGKDSSEWPQDLRVQEIPATR